jgi:dTMP kinase
MLQQRLKQEGRPVELVADPGTTAIGTAIRQILLHNDAPISTMAQMLLFSAARAELAAYIRDRLAEGVTVICDRWLLSTLVYQGEINGVAPQLILSIFNGTSNAVPDLCILLDLDPETAMTRIEKPRDRYERRSLADRKRMRVAYKSFARLTEAGQRVATINACLSADDAHQEAYRLYRNLARATAAI